MHLSVAWFVILCIFAGIGSLVVLMMFVALIGYFVSVVQHHIWLNKNLSNLTDLFPDKIE